MVKKALSAKAGERLRMKKRQAEKEALARKAAAAEPKALDPLMETLRAYMLAKPGCEEDFPFGPEAMVFRVCGKIFGLMAWEQVPVYISLKCDPDRSVLLREQHSGITGAYHMNKVHWHSVAMDGSVDLDLARELMDRSYELIVDTLPSKGRERLQGL